MKDYRKTKKVKEWFTLRFGYLPRDDDIYFMEWVERIVYGQGAGIHAMDEKSRRIWESVNG